MKLVRFGPQGKERPGVIDREGNIRDLSAIVSDITSQELSVHALKVLSSTDPETLPLVPYGARLGCPIANIGKIIGVGLNYRDHAEECGAAIPQSPILFLKAITSIVGPDDAIELPVGSTSTDWEVELAIVIGTQAKNVSEAQALSYVAGYCLAHDVSERHDQLHLGSQWTKGKCHDTFCPVGPWLVTSDEISDVQSLSMWCEVNGKRMQNSNTSNMIFTVAQCIADISRYMTLMPGDLIITGTPAGVGLGQKPPIYLKPGDVVSLGIESLGTQTQSVLAGDSP